MGYLREKYTDAYYLKRTADRRPTAYGVEGLEEFQRGMIRDQDRRILERLDFRNRRVLDVGFGRGEALKYAWEHGAKATVGVDFSPAALSIARQFLRDHGVEAELHCDDALAFVSRLSSSGATPRFDIVLMLDVVEHIPRSELTQLFGHLTTILGERGLIAINTPVFVVDNDVFSEGLKPDARDTTDDFAETSGMHCNRYTRESLQRYMETCGFVGISWQCFVPGLTVEPGLEASASAWWRAFEYGYPVRSCAALEAERFEQAFSLDKSRVPLPQSDRSFPHTKSWTATGKRLGRAIARRCGYSITDTDVVRVNISSGPLAGRCVVTRRWAINREVADQIARGEYRLAETHALECLRGVRGGVVWQIGAGNAYATFALANLVGPDGHVFVFEWRPGALSLLESNTGERGDLHTRVTVINCKPWNYDVMPSSRARTPLPIQSNARNLKNVLIDAQQGASPTSLSIDQIVESGCLSEPALLHVDARGAEVKILDGALTTLHQSQLPLLLRIYDARTMLLSASILARARYETSALDLHDVDSCSILARSPADAGNNEDQVIERRIWRAPVIRQRRMSNE